MVAHTHETSLRGGLHGAISRRNAFNSMCLQHILPALAEIIPPVGRYAINVYGRDIANLLYATGDGTSAVVRSAWEVQQGRKIGQLGYNARVEHLHGD